MFVDLAAGEQLHLRQGFEGHGTLVISVGDTDSQPALLMEDSTEWYGLIVNDHLTISRNLFGTTFYTLVGFHALHVTVGVIAMLIVLGLALSRQITEAHGTAAHLVSWYWHFVDGVWIVVFTVVYL